MTSPAGQQRQDSLIRQLQGAVAALQGAGLDLAVIVAPATAGRNRIVPGASGVYAIRGATSDDLEAWSISDLGALEWWGRPSAAYAALVDETPDVGSHWRLSDAAGDAVDELGVQNGTYAGAGVTRDTPSLLLDDADTSARVTSDVSAITFGTTYLFRNRAPFSLELLCNLGSGDSGQTRHIFGNGEWKLAQVGENLRAQRGAVNVTTALPYGATVHVVMTYDGDFICLYVNGALVGGPTADTANNTGATVDETLRIGGKLGDYDELAVYSRALTPGEVEQHYLTALTEADRMPDTGLDREGPAALKVVTSLAPAGYGDLKLRVLDLTGAVDGTSFLRLAEQSTDPDVPAVGEVFVYAKDNGAGKTALYARFNTGAVQQVAIQP